MASELTKEEIEEMENDPSYWAMLFGLGRRLRNRGLPVSRAWKHNYRNYISSSPWKEKVEQAKAQAGERCQLCNSDKNLQTHHRTYDRLGQEEPGDLTVLCKSCHKRFHS